MLQLNFIMIYIIHAATQFYNDLHNSKNLGIEYNKLLFFKK